jgi:hypothetical protein
MSALDIPQPAVESKNLLVAVSSSLINVKVCHAAQRLRVKLSATAPAIRALGHEMTTAIFLLKGHGGHPVFQRYRSDGPPPQVDES